MTRNLTIGLLLAPALIIIVLLFYGGFLLGVMQSFSYMPLIGLNRPNLDAYRGFFTDDQFIRSFLFTFWISLSTTVLTVVLAVITALALRRSFAGRPGVNFLYQLPITVPHIVIAVGTVFLFSQSGSFARLAFHAGLITDPGEFPQMVNDRLGLGIIYVYLWKQVPFIGVIVMSVMQSIVNDYEEPARTLGAGRGQRFRHVVLPLIIPGILPGSIICFAFTFGSYEVPFLLGRPYPAALSVLAYRLYDNIDLKARPRAMAAAVFITVFLMLFAAVYRRIIHRGPGRRG